MGSEGDGYGKPPKNGQFQKGQSGNPKGRPKGTQNVATVLRRTLREKVAITENGRHKVITKLQAAVKQLVNKAASGDLSAFRLLAALAQSGEEHAEAGGQSSVNDWNELDRKVMEGILKRFNPNNSEG